MKRFHLAIIVVGFAFLFGGVSGCASTKDSTRTSNKRNQPNTVEVTNSSLQLVDYLRRLPGVYIQGSGGDVRIHIRGINSYQGITEPLFVINGQRVGRSYSQASSMVDVNDIQSIRVLKDPEASANYGMAGSNGVIEIKTKNGS